ncbi:MAG: hypothetical protein ACU85U_17945 [Gammaproteobacteria bacterium]
MSAPELLYGTRKAADLPAGVPLATATEVIELASVEIYYSLFELPMAAVLPRLPQSLHPSVPAVLATSFWRVAESSCGPFEFAYTGIACRTGIKPRHFVFGAWCDNADAGQLFRDRYGIACMPAAVSCRESYDRIRGVVAVDGAVVMDIVTHNMVSLAGAGGMVKYSPALGLAQTNGEQKLIQFEASYEFKRVLRGAVSAEQFDAGAIGEATLRPRHSIAGTFAVCDVALLPPRFAVDLDVPAEAGGATKIKAP